jgi:hypothetical protein
VIRPRRHRRHRHSHNKIICRERNIIERFLTRLTHFRRVATCYNGCSQTSAASSKLPLLLSALNENEIVPSFKSKHEWALVNEGPLWRT